MRILALLISVSLLLYQVVQIISILLKDYKRLTEYGFGYLIGNIIIGIIFGGISFYLGKKIFQNKSAKDTN